MYHCDARSVHTSRRSREGRRNGGASSPKRDEYGTRCEKPQMRPVRLQSREGLPSPYLPGSVRSFRSRTPTPSARKGLEVEQQNAYSRKLSSAKTWACPQHREARAGTLRRQGTVNSDGQGDGNYGRK